MRFEIMTERELAWRVFAGEYNATTAQLEPEKEREPGYLITPVGAKINRVYVVGVLTDVEKIEKNGNVNYRARVSDRTGVFYIYAGQYDPNVINVLSTLEPPKYVAVIGKSRMYSPNENTTYVSIRPERIVEVDKSIRDNWLLDAAKSLKTRLEALTEAKSMEPPAVEKLEKLGFGPTVAAGIIESLKHYDQPELEQYRNMLVEILKYLVTDDGESYVVTENEYTADINDLTAEFKSGDELTGEENPEADDEDLEFEANEDEEIKAPELDEETQVQAEQLLEIVGTFNGDKYRHGVPWHELVAEAVDKGIDKNHIEDIVNDLLNKGKIYEPMLGRIKCTG
jgi:RPA family protein